MSNPPPLPTPKMPPKVDKKELPPNYCIIHKGTLEGEVYTCEKCGAKMCYSCALKRKNEENKPFCPKCTTYLFVK